MFFKVICDFSILTDKVFVHAGPRYALEYILGAEYNSKIKILKGTNKIIPTIVTNNFHIFRAEFMLKDKA